MAIISSTASPTAAPSETPSTTTTNNQTVSTSSISPETAAVLVAIIVPVVVIAIVVLCFFQIKKHWKLRQAQAAAAAIVGTSPELVGPLGDVQLYLQHKAELSGERREHDMQAEGDVYELMDHDERQEMSGEDIQQPMLSLGERHELRGEDHARELDTSQDQQDPRRDPNGYSFDEPMFVDFNESVLSLREFT